MPIFVPVRTDGRDLVDLYHAQFKLTLVEQFQYLGAPDIWLLGLVVEPVSTARPAGPPHPSLYRL